MIPAAGIGHSAFAQNHCCCCCYRLLTPQASLRGDQVQAWGARIPCLRNLALEDCTAGDGGGARSKPSRNEPVKFTMTSNCPQLPVHIKAIFPWFPQTPIPLPPSTPINDLNANTSGMVLLSVLGYRRKWVTQTIRYCDLSPHWLLRAPGPPAQTQSGGNKSSCWCWEAAEPLLSSRVPATSTVPSPDIGRQHCHSCHRLCSEPPAACRQVIPRFLLGCVILSPSSLPLLLSSFL